MNGRGWVLLAAWCVLLALGVIWVQQRLVVSADLRLFMPEPRTEEQKLLVQNIGESPASRLLLVAIGGDEPRALASLSNKLAAALRSRPEFGHRQWRGG
jgi:predicted exporter